MTMMLIAILVTGEVTMIEVDHDLCQQAYVMVERNEVVSLDMPDGRKRVGIKALSCVPASLFEADSTDLAEKPE